MSVPILTTKLNTPPLRPQRVNRPHLIQRLNAGLSGPEGFTRKLSFISAPAGYGKTTLITEWLSRPALESDSTPSPRVAWLSLDEGDNDPVRFLSYIIAALQQVHPGFGTATQELLSSPQPPPQEIILTILVNELAAIQTASILILDDYHTIHTETIHQQLVFLLEHQPAFVHLVIITREDPLLPLASLRAKGQMLEIRWDDLRFSIQECAIFLQAIMGIPLAEEDISALERRTEGWIAGLQLAALSMQGQTDPAEFVRAFTGSSRFVLDYLIEEVFKRQSCEIQNFLLQTSILDRLSGPLCSAVAESPDSQAHLEVLELTNLFITSLDQSRIWYRYHRLFAELLRHRLRTSTTYSEPELHNRASSWFEANHFIAEAVQHAIAGGNWNRAGSLISNVNTEMLKRGEITTLIRWFRAFPKDILLNNPKLCFDYCWPLLLTGQFDIVEPLLEHIEKAASEIPIFLGEVMAAQAYLARGRGENDRMVERSQRALTLLPKTSLISRGLVSINLGLAYWHAGGMADAETALAEALEAGQASQNDYAVLTALIFQGRVQAVRGQLHKAAEFARRAVEMGGQIPINTLAHLDLCALQYEWNSLADSLAHLRTAIKISQRGQNDEFTVACWMMMTRLRLAQGDLQGADKYRSLIQKRIEQGGIPIAISRRAAAGQVLFSLAQNDPESALEWADQLDEHTDSHNFTRFLGLTQARLLLAQKDYPSARERLNQLYEMASQGGWQYGVIAVRVWQTLAAETQSAALGYLSEAIRLARPEGFIQTFVEAGQGLVPLLQEAARKGIEPLYAGVILSALAASGPGNRVAGQSSLVEPLSGREIEVLRLVAAGLSNRQIAAKLVISLGTAKTHVHNICGKLGTRNRTEAAGRAKELGLV